MALRTTPILFPGKVSSALPLVSVIVYILERSDLFKEQVRTSTMLSWELEMKKTCSELDSSEPW